MRTLVAAGLVLCLTAPVCLAGAKSVYTSTRCVMGMAAGPDGSLWVATRGGVLLRSPAGEWRKFTRLDGLPSNEALSASAAGGEVRVTFPRASAAWKDGKWVPGPEQPAKSGASVLWKGATYVATLGGLRIQEGGTQKTVGLPPSRGSHISALLPRGGLLWAAMFGDGLWAYGGKSWKRLSTGLPEKAREITALAAAGGDVWVGTRREGVWQYDGKTWRQHPRPGEPYEHNCQSLIVYRGRLLAGTLEDGLVIRTEKDWLRCAQPTISSNAPRQMVEFRGSLYLRHGNGKVDRLDGEKWVRDVCSVLPRKQASALAADSDRLYAAQWGGWSEFDGGHWTHHLDLPELQGIQITTLFPDGEKLWIGAQGRGLAEYDRAGGTLRFHDERLGLPDDLVKRVIRMGDRVYAGTLAGGLAWWDGRKWTSVPELSGSEITALVSDGSGNLIVAARNGMWRRSVEGTMSRVGESPADEAQALCMDGNTLWVGTRTGICRLPSRE